MILTEVEFSPCSIIELDICDICNPPCYSSIKIFNVDGFVVCTSYLSLFLHTDFSPHKFRTKTAYILIKLCAIHCTMCIL